MDLSSLTKRLEAELRSSVQKLVLVPWTEREEEVDGGVERALVVAQLSRLTDVVAEEGAIEGASVMEAHGSTGGATLFEGHQMAVRFMLEAGKINLCLRITDEHVDGVLRARRRAAASAPDARENAVVIEGAMGLLLSACWAHREGLQVTDIALASGVLVKAILAVLAPGTLRVPLALLVLRWLSALGTPMALTAIGESRIVAALTRDNFFALLPHFFNSEAVAAAPNTLVLAGAAGAASIVATEDFYIGPRAKLLALTTPDSAAAFMISAAAGMPAQCIEAGAVSIWFGAIPLCPYATSSTAAKASLTAVAQATVGGVAAIAAARRKIRPLLDLFALK